MKRGRNLLHPEGAEPAACCLTVEVRRTCAGMMAALLAAHWEVFRRLSDVEMATVLREAAGPERSR